MRDIGKANFYKSYFLAGKKLNDTDRLNFYDAIFNYIFEGTEPNEKNNFLVDLVFTTIKPFIDADLSRKAGGAPVGNSNAKKQLKNNLENNIENNLKTNKVEVEVEEEVNVEEKVEVEVTTPTLLTTRNIIKDFAATNGFKFGAKTITELTESLNKTLDPLGNLNAQLDFVKSKYPNKTGDELAKIFVASLHWDNVKPAQKPKTKNIKSIDYSLAPKKCECGASVTPWGVPNSVKCVACSKTWELNNNGLWVSTN